MREWRNECEPNKTEKGMGRDHRNIILSYTLLSCWHWQLVYPPPPPMNPISSFHNLPTFHALKNSQLPEKGRFRRLPFISRFSVCKLHRYAKIKLLCSPSSQVDDRRARTLIKPPHRLPTVEHASLGRRIRFRELKVTNVAPVVDVLPRSN